MPNYRRLHQPGATWFFTVTLAQRNNNSLLMDHVDRLREAFRHVRQRHHFTIDAIVVMPDHLHCLWTLPDGDTDNATRWRLLKGHFSRSVIPTEHRSQSRLKRRERGIWPRRFWTHWITDQEDFNRHVDYIHWNPVKHGLVQRATDWPYSSIHRYIARGDYPPDWGFEGHFGTAFGE